MFLHASPQDDFRAAEIAAQNAEAAAQGSRESFRATEIVAQNQAAASSTTSKIWMAAGGLFVLYYLVSKGMK